MSLGLSNHSGVVTANSLEKGFWMVDYLWMWSELIVRWVHVLRALPGSVLHSILLL